MTYVTPRGGSSASCDPISLLRGAGGNAGGATVDERRANQQKLRSVAVHFIEFVLSEEGQKIWCYRPGLPAAVGGPERFALRRVPVRRDFYPSTQPAINAAAVEHERYAADPLADPTIDPYQLAKDFTYRPRWTGAHFGIQRKLIKAMCMDSADELHAAWGAILAAGGPDKQPKAMEILQRQPTLELTNPKSGALDTVVFNWRTAPTLLKTYDALEVQRKWSAAFRETYERAQSAVVAQ